MDDQATSYRTYWAIWGLLLILTLGMMAVESATFPRAIAIAVLLAAMMVKAAFILGWFMHLRFERQALRLTVVLATVLTIVFLFGLLAPDGVYMNRLAP
jgi:caa(3)-type oxidase subunit IV